MNIESLLIQSLQLLGLGMGAVFVILVLLIAVITLVSRIVPTPVVNPSGMAESNVDANHIAAISAAIHHYRNRR